MPTVTYFRKKNICTWQYRKMSVLLPQGRIQEIKCMMLVYFTHGLFLTCTQKSHFINRSFIAIFRYSILSRPTPCTSIRQPPLYLLGEPASLLVRTNTDPPMSWVCQQLPHPLLCPSHSFTPHSSNYIIYIDDINNSQLSSSGTMFSLKYSYYYPENFKMYWRIAIFQNLVKIIVL
jgi:hypothetical protein